MTAPDDEHAPTTPLWPPVLDRFVVVLVEPQLGLNVGAVVRAMKNMGLTRLRLVAPSAQIDLAEVQRIAHRTQELVDAIEVFERLDQAVADCHRAVGLTARARTREWPAATPRERIPQLVALAERAGEQIAIVFGRERHGLSNEELERCDELLTIPTRRDYASLNLAQATLLVCYELFLAASAPSEPLAQADSAPHLVEAPRTVADKAQRLRLLAQAVHTLDAIGFFKSKARHGVEHTLARVIARARLDPRETRMLTGMAVEVLKFAERVRRGIVPPQAPSATVGAIDPELERLFDDQD